MKPSIRFLLASLLLLAAFVATADAAAAALARQSGAFGIVTYDPPEPVAPDIAIATNALPTASWGYTVAHLGEFHNETAVVLTNGIATWTAPAALENVRFLVVGGGGGGGGDVNSGDGYQGGAGGGGGGVVTGVVYSIAQDATVLTTVGAGGAAGKAGTAVNSKYGAGKAGSASSIKVDGVTYVTANGGGQDGGATGKYASGGQAGGSGGSSAGSRPQVTDRGMATKGSIGSSVTDLLSAELFGNQGGAGLSGVKYVSGGGGGATEEGGTPSDYSTGGKGGEGLASDITGSLAVYGSGGGGGTAASGGVGGLAGTGAGDGHRTAKGKGVDALPNQGGGGGGGGGQANGGNGGSGIVVLRYVSGEGVIVEAEVSAKILNPEYTGEVVSCGLAETAGYTVSGATATAAGDYTATVAPKEGYIWDDGTTETKDFAWSATLPAFTDPEGNEIIDPVVVDWLSSNGFSQDDIDALGDDAAATDKFYECFLLNLDFQVRDAGATIGLTDIAVSNDVVSVTIELVRKAPLGAIYGVLYLYGANDLASGFGEKPIDETFIDFGADDPSFDTDPAYGSVTQTVTATFSTDMVSETFFKAGIGVLMPDDPWEPWEPWEPGDPDDPDDPEDPGDPEEP